jgi:16S rRNA (adenine1518-N6/adenine1519-N6)-dimethyltransferase
VSGDPLPPLREVIARHGLAAKRALGQNFLLDLNLTRKIARAAAPLSGFSIVEIGPGPGGLTRALLAEGADRVVAIERDQRALPALEEIGNAYPGRLTVIHGDALRVNMPQHVSGPAKIVANLPYNIATPLLLSWIGTQHWPPWFASLTLMFQKEVAERIVAKPGSGAYGRLSVIAQWRSTARKLFDIDRNAFVPPPNVTSSLVELIPREAPDPPCSVGALEQTTAAAFGQRRKMLRSSLRSLFKDPESTLAPLGIDAWRRAEELSVADFARIAQLIDMKR